MISPCALDAAGCSDPSHDAAAAAYVAPVQLILFFAAVYGAAWIVTRSSLTGGLRIRIRHVPFLGHLAQCIVCTGTWMAAGLCTMAPHSTVLGNPSINLVDGIVLVAASVLVNWGLGHLLGDAD